MKKRVAIFRSSLLPISETFIRDQASALTSWEPILIGRTKVKDGLEISNINHKIVPERGNRILQALRFWLQRPDPNFTEQLKQLKVSLVHAHFGTDATKIWPSVKAAKLPMVVTLHGYDINTYQWWWEAGHGGLRGRLYPRQLLKMAKDPSVNFIAVSKAIKQRAIEYGIPEKKITVSYIGVDTERFKPGGLPIEQRRKRILFVGRMVENKAPLLMVHIYAEIRKKIPDAELTMIGTGLLLNEAKQLANDLNINIEFLGACTSSEVLTQLNQSRCFCLPSITIPDGSSEGLGMVIIEAQSCGIPVVTSARGGSTEGIIHESTGYSFNEGDVEQAVMQLIKLLSSDKLTASFSVAAISLARKIFDISARTKSLENIYVKFAPKEL